jgi:beta-xylosidase
VATKPDLHLIQWEYDALSAFLHSVSDRAGMEHLRKWLLYLMMELQAPAGTEAIDNLLKAVNVDE